MMVLSSPQGLFKNLIYLPMKTFINGLQTEFQKIVWPKPAEAFWTAVLVIAIAVLIGYYLGLLDAAFGAILRLIIG